MSERAATIYLVRHGEAAASWGQSPDPGLSELGGRQAQRTAKQLLELTGDRPCRLVSSPLLRARETAAPLADALGATVQIDDRYREIPSPVPLESRQQWLRGFMQGQWSDQEPALHSWRRAIIEGIASLDGPTVIFSHFLVLNTIVGWLRKADETLLFWPANGSITTLLPQSQGWEANLGEVMRSHVN